jgi:hypothetical protein
MITISKYFKIQNLEDELERLETKIIKQKNISRFDLQELEGLANEIMYERMKTANLVKEN